MPESTAYALWNVDTDRSWELQVLEDGREKRLTVLPAPGEDPADAGTVNPMLRACTWRLSAGGYATSGPWREFGHPRDFVWKITVNPKEAPMPMTDHDHAEVDRVMFPDRPLVKVIPVSPTLAVAVEESHNILIAMTHPRTGAVTGRTDIITNVEDLEQALHAARMWVAMEES